MDKYQILYTSSNGLQNQSQNQVWLGGENSDSDLEYLSLNHPHLVLEVGQDEDQYHDQNQFQLHDQDQDQFPSQLQFQDANRDQDEDLHPNPFTTPFSEVSVKYERFLSCSDCGRNFVSKQQYNLHLDDCGTSEDYEALSELIAYPPRRASQKSNQERIQVPTTTSLPNTVVTNPNPNQNSNPNANQNSNPSTAPTASSLMKSEKAISFTLNLASINNNVSNARRSRKSLEDSNSNSNSNSVTYTFDPQQQQQQQQQRKTAGGSRTSSRVGSGNGSGSEPAEGSASRCSSPSDSYATPTFEGFLEKDKDKLASLVQPQGRYVGSNGKIVEPLQCHICHKVYNTKYGFKLHLRTHTGNKGYTCDLCGKSFSQSGHLKDHRRIHTGEKPFTCTICGKKFAQNQNLKHHLRMHTGIGPFRCNLCDKSFFTKREYESHEKVHTGERLLPGENLTLTPYPCDICGATFKRKGSLNQHVKFHFVSPQETGQMAVSSS